MACERPDMLGEHLFGEHLQYHMLDNKLPAFTNVIPTRLRPVGVYNWKTGVSLFDLQSSFIGLSGMIGRSHANAMTRNDLRRRELTLCCHEVCFLPLACQL
jgi:hypothetical protein